MAMRREAGAQDDLVATWAEIPRSPGHAFYDRLQTLLKEVGFDVFVEDICKPYYAARMGAPSLPLRRYCRLRMATSKGSTANAELSGGPGGGLWQPQSAAFRRRQGSHAQAR